MNKILKDQSNRIWKDSNGRVLRTQDFNTQVLQNGLAFWSGADANYMTLVSGKISELYDYRDPGKTGTTYGKMVQATDANRPIFLNNAVYFPVSVIGQCLQHTYSTTAYTIFAVFMQQARSTQGCGIGTDTNRGLYVFGNTIGIQSESQRGLYKYINTSKFGASNTSTTFPNISTGINIFGYSGNLKIGDIGGGGALDLKCCEFGWYNRILSEPEVAYNQNALMQKFGLV